MLSASFPQHADEVEVGSWPSGGIKMVEMQGEKHWPFFFQESNVPTIQLEGDGTKFKYLNPWFTCFETPSDFSWRGEGEESNLSWKRQGVEFQYMNRSKFALENLCNDAWDLLDPWKTHEIHWNILGLDEQSSIPVEPLRLSCFSPITERLNELKTQMKGWHFGVFVPRYSWILRTGCVVIFQRISSSHLWHWPGRTVQNAVAGAPSIA